MATHHVGDTVSAYMDSYNLVINETYVVDWSLNTGPIRQFQLDCLQHIQL